MTRGLINAVIILGITWFSAQALRHVSGRPAPTAVERVQSVEVVK